MASTNRPRDIEVELTLLPTEHGGRHQPVFTGYRPQFYYSGHDWDAPHEYPDVAQVNPGDTVRAFLAFLSPQEHVGHVKPGMAFLLREGQRVVGYGSVLRIIDLERSAETARAREGRTGAV
ncbi:MAG: elongation factor Tu [Myxococcales bacterium]|nr:elongation factor Tu [Myxococcales bacterium]